jgi:DNA-directed RNA polymerase specialized sigma24 family protein
MPFPPTHWTVLARATLHGDTAAKSALEDFCGQYRQPLSQFIHFQGVVAAEVEDVVQEFLIHVAHDSVLRRADRERGRFRGFLLGALKRFLIRRRAR